MNLNTVKRLRFIPYISSASLVANLVFIFIQVLKPQIDIGIITVSAICSSVVSVICIAYQWWVLTSNVPCERRGHG